MRAVVLLLASLSLLGCPPERRTGDDDDATDAFDDDDATAPCDLVAWWPDLDGDGYGDDGVEPNFDCVAGGATRPLDCDDTNPDIHPDGVEVCNEVDDDCDGAIDGADVADPPIWYPDEDGDGWGDVGSPMAVCDPPPNMVTNGDDCDDNDDAIVPGIEYCPWDRRGTSCADILALDHDEGDGVYRIDYDGPGPELPIVVYCDMTTDGGGWAAILNPEDMVARAPLGTERTAVALSGGGGAGCGVSPPIFADPQLGSYRLRGSTCGDHTGEWTFRWSNVFEAEDVRFTAVVQGFVDRSLELNGELITPTETTTVNGTCDHFNGSGTVVEPDVNQCTTQEHDQPPRLFPGALDGDDLEVVVRAGPACSPTCSYSAGFALHRLWVR